MSNVFQKVGRYGAVLILTSIFALTGITLDASQAKAQAPNQVLEDEYRRFEGRQFRGQGTSGQLVFSWQSQNANMPRVIIRDRGNIQREVRARVVVIYNINDQRDFMVIRNNVGGNQVDRVFIGVNDNFYRRLAARTVRDQDFTIIVDVRNNILAFENNRGNYVTGRAVINY